MSAQDLPVGEPCCSCHQPMPNGIVARPARTPEAVFAADARQTIRDEIVARTDELTAVSHYIHENPELLYKEVKAAAKLTAYLTEQGFEITDFPGLPTAFRVSYTHGSGGRVFGFNSEYDALPDIGHACGHNLIAVSGVAALLGLRSALIRHDIPGTVVLIGTPAEEGGAGKVQLLEAGAYADLGACMMIHPGRGPARAGHVGPSLAVQRISVEYHGKASHAASAPWEGVNALDAATLAYASVSALRQQLKPNVRVHGVITNGGGTAANIIPAYTLMNWAIRGPSSSDVDTVRDKITECFEGAARSTGCSVVIRADVLVKDLRNDKILADEYAATMSDLYDIPVTIGFDQTASIGASTDFGNVTYSMPACHPMYGIPTPPGRANHTREFTEVAKGDVAHDETFKASVAMACVGLRFIGDEGYAKRVVDYYKSEMDK